MISGLDGTLSSLNLGTNKDAARTELGQEEFLKLMITQLRNQDPFKPLESGAFLGQLAQFGTVAGLSDLNSSFTGLASSLVSNQGLQAASLVGHKVMTQIDHASLPANGALEGAVDLPIGSGTVRMQVMSADGQIVRQIELGSHPDGLMDFSWSGLTDAGEQAPPGMYTVAAQYFDGGSMQSAPILMKAKVASVSLGAAGLTVRLDGIGEVPFSTVREIG
jgi:flagellar basal-body rod modification protein FlgD